MAAILAQSTPPLLCACADAHDLVFVNMDVNITIHVILESAKDTVNKVLKQNNVEQIIYMSNTGEYTLQAFPDSKVHGANMGPIWGQQDPGGPHVGPMNFAIWELVLLVFRSSCQDLDSVILISIQYKFCLYKLSYVKTW